MNMFSTSGFEDMESEKVRSTKLDELRAEIQIGLDAYNRGDYAPLDIDALKSDLRERVQSK